MTETFAIGFEENKLKVRILGLKKGEETFQLQLKQNNHVLAQKVISKTSLSPQKLIILNLVQQKLKPGTYQLILTSNKKVFTHSFKVAKDKSATNNKELEILKKQYLKTPTPALRKKIFSLSTNN